MAGYFIGWFFRKLTRLIMVVVALVIALLAYGKLAGCDMTRAQEEAKRGGEWAQHETATVENYLKSILPSAAAGAWEPFWASGAGVKWSSRNRAIQTAAER